MLRQLSLTQIKESVGTHSREFGRVGRFKAFLTKWTEAGGRWGEAKRPEGPGNQQARGRIAALYL